MKFSPVYYDLLRLTLSAVVLTPGFRSCALSNQPLTGVLNLLTVRPEFMQPPCLCGSSTHRSISTDPLATCAAVDRWDRQTLTVHVSYRILHAWTAYWIGMSVRCCVEIMNCYWLVRWGVGVVICLERGADCLQMVQLLPLPSQNPIISCLF